jgi:AraC-like DNA-binding protein
MPNKKNIRLLFYCFAFILSKANALNATAKTDSLLKIQKAEKMKTLKTSLKLFEKALEEKSADSVELFKKIAITSAELKKPNKAAKFTEKYITQSADVSLINSESFKAIKNTEPFIKIEKKFKSEFNFLFFLYVYVALIGFYFAIVIQFKTNTDKIAKVLIGGFILVHSVFILEFFLYASNYQFHVPHTLYISASVAMLYGPLLYFYFKRITTSYSFKKRDVLHLLPALLIITICIPIYFSSGAEKIKIILGVSTVFNKENGVYLIFLPKLTSLIIYGFFIGKIHFNKKNQLLLKRIPEIAKWEKNIFKIHIAFLVSYLIYGVSVITSSGASTIITHSQVIVMSAMVLYIVHMAYVQPKIFNTVTTSKTVDSLLSKYKKSGLTPTLSLELKDSLINLMMSEKIFKDNSLNLETLSVKLETTRHNTSQIINEHFNMNFFELINSFRIKEAIEILKSDTHGSLNIIDIAYEVGYNNKVTFNKAFKKVTSLTPTEYLETLYQM